MQEQVLSLFDNKAGFILFSSLPGGGLTTMTDMVLDSTDRYMRNFVTVEDEQKRDRELENIPVTTYDSAAGEGPDTVLPKLIRTYPDLYVVRDLVNVETVRILCEQIREENRMVISTVRAREAPEALLRVLLMKIPPSEFAPVATAVLNMRMIRKLCEKCKEAYAPPPEILKQLGLPEGRIEAFYRPPTQPIDPKNPDKVCEECLGIGYRGRTAIFELLVVDDAIRNVLATQPKLELLRAAVRKSKQRSLQEEGVLLVVKGVTSLPELMRVLKQGT
jgi:type II secretory ATPase GspE/PulE/Tfp pilus assembly ATPase PilB-like protein